MIIVFGSERTQNILIPLWSVGIRARQVPCHGNIFFRIKGIWALLYECYKERDAFILADSPQWVGLVTMAVAAIFRRDYIIRLRGLVFEERPCPLYQYMNRQILRRARAVIFISRYMLRAMTDELRHLNRYTAIPDPCLPLPAGGTPPENDFILTVTGFHFFQKIKPLLSVFPVIDKLLERYPSLKWIICGGGPHLKEAKRARAECRNRGRIILEGHCEDVHAYYARAKVFFYFTGLDTFALVVNQAFASGLTVVANRDVVMPDMIDDQEDGYLIDTSLECWQEDLYGALSDLIDQPEMAAGMGENGKRKVMGLYAPERVGAMYKSFFNELRSPFNRTN